MLAAITSGMIEPGKGEKGGWDWITAEAAYQNEKENKTKQVMVTGVNLRIRCLRSK